MPVVRRGNHDGVNVLAGQQLAPVANRGAAFERAGGPLARVVGSHLFARVFHAPGIDVTEGYSLSVRFVEKAGDIGINRRPAGADEAEGNAVAGRDGALGPQNRRLKPAL